MNVTVSIPVTLGGYAGQRDAWEQYERPYAVSLGDDAMITLEQTSTPRRKIQFKESELAAALDFIREHK